MKDEKINKDEVKGTVEPRRAQDGESGQGLKEKILKAIRGGPWKNVAGSMREKHLHIEIDEHRDLIIVAAEQEGYACWDDEYREWVECDQCCKLLFQYSYIIWDYEKDGYWDGYAEETEYVFVESDGEIIYDEDEELAEFLAEVVVEEVQ